MTSIERYTGPLTGLKENFILKTLISILAALFASDYQLVVLVVVLIIMDFFTGLYAAKIRKDNITSKGFRQTVVKSIEYTFLLLGCTAVANSFTIIDWIDEIAYLFTALTELKSIVENITASDSPARNIWFMIRKEISSRGDVIFDPENAKPIAVVVPTEIVIPIDTPDETQIP